MSSKKALFYSTGTLLSLIGLSAVAVGVALIINPEGGSGLTVELLKDSPFKDYMIPGILLLAIIGIASLAGAVLAFMKHRYTSVATMALGLAMVIWMFAQVYWMGWQSWLQPTFLAVGVLELGLGFFMYEWNQQDHGMFHHRGTHAH